METSQGNAIMLDIKIFNILLKHYELLKPVTYVIL